MTLHLVEPGGRGGVYQHTLALAELMSAGGHPVVLHTARDFEVVAPDPVTMCPCVDWLRDRPRGRRRSAALVIAYLRTLRHLHRVLGRQDVLHFQGGYRAPLTHLTLRLGRTARARVVFSPHNTFERYGGSTWWLRRSMATAHTTVVFSHPDVAAVARAGGRPAVSPLIQWTPPVGSSAVRGWRRRWGAAEGGRVVLFAGQVRPDKRPDLLILSAPVWMGPGDVLAFVGEDKGAAAAARELAVEHGVPVSWCTEYLALDDFVAAVAAADVVVCPYDTASQSGVLSVAQAVGTVTVATDVGGLAELADVVVPAGDAAALGRGIVAASTHTGSLRSSGTDAASRDVHLRAYGW